MAAATTVAQSIYVRISWVEPDDQGASITTYRITLAQHDGTTFVETTTYCNGASSTTVSNKYCLVPMSALRASPFLLSKGDLVQVQVYAQNLKGWSTAAPTNTAGAVVETEPTTPAAPVRVATTDDTSLDVSWTALTSEGDRGGPSATI